MLSIGLVILITLVTMKDVIIYGDYIINKDFIVNNLCINRAKPETKCQGKCHLNKRLQESRQEQEELPYTLLDKGTSINLICQCELILAPYFLPSLKYKAIKGKPNFYSFSLEEQIFHPPEV